MRVIRSTIPADSLVGKYLPADYTDVFACQVGADDADGARKISPDDIMTAFWTGSPLWVRALFGLRNFLVRFVGLKGSASRDLQEFTNAIRRGETFGFVSVPAKNDRETVLLLTDKHLDAYVSVYVGDADVLAITLVHFKNALGHVYFFVIRPFHALVVKSMLRRAVRKALK